MTFANFPLYFLNIYYLDIQLYVCRQKLYTRKIGATGDTLNAKSFLITLLKV